MKYCLLFVALFSSITYSQWNIAKHNMVTRWGSQVTPENAWWEYPRPQMVRSHWQNLNGLWDYAVVGKVQSKPGNWEGVILVPFCLESALSGVKGKLGENDALWYRRTFCHSAPSDTRTLLNFEAVDYEMTVWINGVEKGSHIGGHVPFHFDVTDAVKAGENEIVVRVYDATSEQFQPRGKQTHNPGGIWYTAVSGIWQTVWLESVPQRYISNIKIDTEINPARIKVQPVLKGNAVNNEKVQVIVRANGRIVADRQGTGEIALQIENAKLWSPDSPFLYDLEILLLDGKGEIVDRITSYAGIRTIGKKKDAQGHWRFTLNDEIIFHWGTLDQGWWPDGLLTPPSDEAMVYDIQYLKDAGFNMIRKHVTVENRRYYYHTDRLGMLVWQDHANSYHPRPKWIPLHDTAKIEDAEWPDDAHRQWMYELKQMVDALYNHPSIVVWVPFNEAWGQHRTMTVGNWLSSYDKTRHLNIASGGNFWPVGDIADQHRYPHPFFPLDDARFTDFIKVVGEFGGHGLAVKGHLWDPERGNWGYGGAAPTREELLKRYTQSIEMLAELKDNGVAAGVYTQTTDVEIEVNGVLTYDRAVQKIDIETLRKLHKNFE